MTPALITIDTELSPGLHQRGWSAADNHASSVEGRAGSAAFGIGWQMDVLEAAGLTGVFFVDPMPALVYGPQILPLIVGPVLARRHEVQLHIHTEWLEWAPTSPVDGRQGRCIGDFVLADQLTLIDLARDLLQAAGAPPPTAFRAGNYGADARTAVALERLGFAWDSSANAACPDVSRIAARVIGNAPTRLGGLIELPITTIADLPGQVRPAQVCALSAREMAAGLNHAAEGNEPFVVVTHSFEMLSRDRRRPNRQVIERFRRLCARVTENPRLRGVGFRDLEPARVLAAAPRPLLAPSRPRTWARMAEQAIGTVLYERSAG